MDHSVWPSRPPNSLSIYFKRYDQANIGKSTSLININPSFLIPFHFPPWKEDSVESSNKKLARQCHSISRASLEVVTSCGLTRSIGNKMMKPSDGGGGYISVLDTRKSGKLSAEETMRLAGKILTQSYSQTVDGHSGFAQLPCHLSVSGLSEQDLKNVRLALLLLAAAEKISQRQCERADRLLDRCDSNSDDTGNPVERVVFYFSEALRERIDREAGRVSDKGLGKRLSMSCVEATMMKNLCVIPSYYQTPFPKITQFAGTQAIIENVVESNKIHIIHMGIPFASPWMLLIEALTATRRDSFELLKITAVWKSCLHMVEETCKSLEKFAESKNVPFCYKIVIISDFHDLKEELLEIESDETVAVFATYVLKTMLRTPDRLDHVMGIISRIAPAVTVIIENDANHNSPVFENRFIEVLFFFSAYFDCLGECLRYDEKNRRVMEGVLFGECIRNMVASEGDERKVTNVKIEVWRELLERYGPKEVQFSMSSLYQTNLLLKECPNGRHCMLEMNDKALVVCWKGVPMHFVSVWKFG